MSRKIMDLYVRNILPKSIMKIIILLLLIVSTSCENKKELVTEKSTNELKWLVTGLPDAHFVENTIAKMYGFQFVPFGGCFVSNQLRDSINKENQIVNTILSTKYGKNWKIDFDKRVTYVDSILLSCRYHYSNL
jgi:hypothetical protein